MKRLMMGITLAMVGLLNGGTAAAQEETDIDIDVEQIEQMAEEMGAVAEQFGEQMEAWAEEHSEELEAWAEEYSGQWEEWAERFEYKMERWAQQQEGVWEEWAENYSTKWEDWGSQLESGEFDPDQMGELIERNLEMLSDMPLGQMMDGLLKEGLGELKDAPWDSLGELTDLVQSSLEQSIKGMEDVADNEETWERLRRGGDEANIALDKLKKGLDLKLKKLDDHANTRLKHLKELLQSNELTDTQRDTIRELAETIKDAKVGRSAEMKEKAKAYQKKAIEAKNHARGRQSKAKDLGDEADALSKFNEALRSKAKAVEKKVRAEQLHARRKAEMIEKKVRAAHEKQMRAEQERAHSFLREAQKKRDSVESKRSDLDELRAEIRKLRDEVKKLKKEKDND